MIKAMLKLAAEAAAFVVVLPALAGYALGSLLIGCARTFPGWSQLLSLFPGLSGAYLRRAFYRMTLRRCGEGACLSFGTVISHASTEIGRNVYTGVGCCLGAVTLEDDVLLGSHVSVTNGCRQHGIERLDVPVREQPGIWTRVTIGRDTWVGERAVVMADVGKHCVIGAGSVVTTPIPDYAIAVGVPARVVRYRNEDTYERTESISPVPRCRPTALGC